MAKFASLILLFLACEGTFSEVHTVLTVPSKSAENGTPQNLISSLSTMTAGISGSTLTSVGITLLSIQCIVSFLDLTLFMQLPMSKTLAGIVTAAFFVAEIVQLALTVVVAKFAGNTWQIGLYCAFIMLCWITTLAGSFYARGFVDVNFELKIVSLASTLRFRVSQANRAASELLKRIVRYTTDRMLESQNAWNDNEKAWRKLTKAERKLTKKKEVKLMLLGEVYNALMEFMDVTDNGGLCDYKMTPKPNEDVSYMISSMLDPKVNKIPPNIIRTADCYWGYDKHIFNYPITGDFRPFKDIDDLVKLIEGSIDNNLVGQLGNQLKELGAKLEALVTKYQGKKGGYLASDVEKEDPLINLNEVDLLPLKTAAGEMMYYRNKLAEATRSHRPIKGDGRYISEANEKAYFAIGVWRSFQRLFPNSLNELPLSWKAFPWMGLFFAARLVLSVVNFGLLCAILNYAAGGQFH